MRFVIFIFLNINFQLFAQVSDEFETAGLKSVWQGDRLKFEVRDGALFSKSSTSKDFFGIGTIYSTKKDLELLLDIDLNFATSSANFIECSLADSLNRGVLLRFGETKDHIALYDLKTNQALNNLFVGHTERSKFHLRIRLRRDTLLVEIRNRDNDVIEHHQMELFLSPLVQFNINIQQSTSSFFGKHKFDNFYIGPLIRDSIPPRIKSVDLPNLSSIQISFSEQIDTNISHIILLDNESIPIPHWIDDQKLELSITEELLNGSTHEITLKDLRDIEGNVLDTSFNIIVAIPSPPSQGDILISEFMPDPSPSIGMSESEYVELFNVSDKYIQTAEIMLGDASKTYALPAYLLAPKELIVLCHAPDLDLFDSGIKILPMDKWPGLNNSYDSLFLSYKHEPICYLAYDLNKHSAHWKHEGGWSYELIDTAYACLGFSAFQFTSDSRGGSPGTFAIDDVTLPSEGFAKIQFVSQKLIQVDFNQKMDTSVVDFYLQNSDNLVDIRSSRWHEEMLLIEVVIPIDTGQLYTLTLESLNDCIGRTRDTTLSFGIPSPVLQGDIVISEILFNPKSGGVDYLEVYNTSSELKDLSTLIVWQNDSNSSKVWWKKLRHSPTLILAKTSAAFCSDPSLTQRYFSPPDTANIYLSNALPQLPDDAGNIGIASISGKLFDFVQYKSSMHSPMIFDKNGVSLEKLVLGQENFESSNWTSAASTYAFGTPGYSNSHQVSLTTAVKFSIEPQIFNPNGDGIDDFVIIKIKNLKPHTAIAVYVFDLFGRVIKTIEEPSFSGTNNIFYWHGDTDSKNLAPPGEYIILIKGQTAQGDRIKFKKAIGLSRYDP